MATIEDFEKLDIRVGKIVEVNDYPEARKPGYKLRIDFGSEIGVKNSFSQIVALYTKDELVGKVVLGVVNFPVRKVGPFESEVLTLGVLNSEGKVVLVTADKPDVVIGGRLY
jgi:tRNA-binding protein